LCVAGGFLTKWTAPAFFYLTVIPLLWWRGQLGRLASRAHLFALIVAGGLCFAWVAAAASQVGWHVLIDTVLREALQRLSPQHHPRPYPWGEVLSFPLVFLAGALPWSAFAAISLHPKFMCLWDERGRRLLQALQCWFWVNLLFWALAPGHRPRHCLPLQPPIAALAALVWLAWIDGRWPWRFRWCRPRGALMGLLAFFLAIKLTSVQGSWGARNRDDHLRAAGAYLAARIPDGTPLNIFRLKDDGLLFYYGRPTRRLTGADPQTLVNDPAYCLLTAAEWSQRRNDGFLQEVAWLKDGQGDPVVLVKTP
jgi:4-amino-4-deoxy-L-arabinose transferase-like glycosyltransferase